MLSLKYALSPYLPVVAPSHGAQDRPPVRVSPMDLLALSEAVFAEVMGSQAHVDLTSGDGPTHGATRSLEQRTRLS